MKKLIQQFLARRCEFSNTGILSFGEAGKIIQVIIYDINERLIAVESSDTDYCVEKQLVLTPKLL